jgi:hypothetical protein
MFRYIAILLVGLVMSGCTTTVRQSAECADVLRQHKRLAIMPTEVKVSVAGLSKEERAYDYEFHLEKAIAEEIAPPLREKGFIVKTITRRDVHNLGMNNDLMHLRQRYNTISTELYSKSMGKSEAESIEQNVGQAAIAFGKRTSSDILVMIDYVGTSTSNSVRALGFAAAMFGVNTGVMGDTSTILVGIIDARNGKVLWINRVGIASSMFGSTFDKSDLTKLISDTLDKLGE